MAEQGPTREVLSPPYHPYTRLLLSSVPEMQTGWLESHRNTREAEQAMQDVVNVGLSGCPFHTRCPRMIPGRCDSQVPAAKDMGNTHYIACHLTGTELSEH